MDRRGFLAGAAAIPLATSACRRRESANTTQAETSNGTNILRPYPTQIVVPLQAVGWLASEPTRAPDQMGLSTDTVFRELGPRILLKTNDLERTPIAPADRYDPNDLLFSVTTDQASYRSAVSTSAHAKGQYGLFKASGSISRDTVDSSDSYSIHLVAVARRVDEAFVYRPGNPPLEDQQAAFIRANYNDKYLLTRTFGDSYIRAVEPVSDLLIDISFATSSSSSREALKAEINASMGANAGGLNIQQTIEKAQSHSRVTVSFSGVTHSTVPKTFDKEELTKTLVAFYEDANPKSHAKLTVEAVANLFDQNKPLNWVDVKAYGRRLSFAEYVRDTTQMLGDTIADAMYATQNSEQFDQVTVTRAANDLQRARVARESLIRAARDAYGAYKNTGRTGREFSEIETLVRIPNDFATYVQLEPSIPVPAPQPVPRPKPPRLDCSDGHCCHGARCP